MPKLYFKLIWFLYANLMGFIQIPFQVVHNGNGKTFFKNMLSKKIRNLL